MSLTSQLNSVFDNFSKNAPRDVFKAITSSKDDFKASFNPASAIKIGDNLPEFSMPNAVGEEIHSSDLVKQGPLLIVFYRGVWCPFCNLTLHAFQAHLDQFTAKGVTLVAISPQLPDTSLDMVEKQNLKFPVLSDVGNKLAKRLGILFQMPDTLRPVFDNFGHDLPKKNGDDSMAVPIPATLLVDRKGVVRNLSVDPDYTKRLEPSTALEWIEDL